MHTVKLKTALAIDGPIRLGGVDRRSRCGEYFDVVDDFFHTLQVLHHSAPASRAGLLTWPRSPIVVAQLHSSSGAFGPLLVGLNQARRRPAHCNNGEHPVATQY